MKIPELRQILDVANKERLERVCVELYKQLPKAKKDEADLIIASVLEGKDGSVPVPKKTIDYEDLFRQIRLFLENAYAQNYFAPNRIIPKNQRPKWRFLVKGYIKDLEQIRSEDEHYAQALELMTALYKMICYACNYYIFSTDDPFRSIGWQQDELFSLLVRKTFVQGYLREEIHNLILLASTGGLSRESLYIHQQMVLISALKTTDLKTIAVEEARKCVEEYEEKLLKCKERDNYYVREAINNLCGMQLMLSLFLSEQESGLAYFFRHEKESRKEIALYRALDYVSCVGEDGDWIDTYRYGVMKKIKPREDLVEKYEKLTKGMN